MKKIMEKSKMPNTKFQLKKKNKVKGDHIKTQNESCTTRMKTMKEEFITKKRDKVCILNQLHGYIYTRLLKSPNSTREFFHLLILYH